MAGEKIVCDFGGFILSQDFGEVEFLDQSNEDFLENEAEENMILATRAV